MSKRTQSGIRRLALMPAGFAKIKRVACLHSLVGKISSNSRCTLTNHELTVASVERRQNVPRWIVVVGAGCWVRRVIDVVSGCGNAAAANDRAYVASMVHYVSPQRMEPWILCVGMTENNRRICNKYCKCYSDEVRELRLEPQELQSVCESF